MIEQPNGGGIASRPGRRKALALLCAAAAAPAARADDTPPTISPVAPPLGPAPTPAPVVRQPPVPAAAIDKTKIYYVFFDQAIDVASMRALRRQLASLVDAGVSEINLVLNSGGGLLEPMLITYSFIRSLPAKINTHAQSVVASAATILFLAGQARSADETARFVFHPSQLTLGGNLDERQIQDRLSQVGSLDEVLAHIYKERTALTDDDIAKFTTGQVIYTADQAKACGYLQTVTELKIPGDQSAKILFLD